MLEAGCRMDLLEPRGAAVTAVYHTPSRPPAGRGCNFAPVLLLRLQTPVPVSLDVRDRHGIERRAITAAQLIVQADDQLPRQDRD
jgi:hypothetical protein